MTKLKKHRTQIVLEDILRNKKATLGKLAIINPDIYKIILEEVSLQDKEFLFGELDEFACLLQDRLDKEILNCKSNLYEDTGIEYDYTDYYLEQDYLLDHINKLQDLIDF